MPQPRGTPIEINLLSEKEGLAAVRETYSDADAALKFFGDYANQRERAFKAFDAALAKDEALVAAFSKNPVGTLQERGLFGPLDRISIDDLYNPFQRFPWPLPWCRLVCRIECRWERHWVCIRILGFRFCWPVWHLHCRWVCRFVCG